GIITLRRWMLESNLLSKRIVLATLMLSSMVCAIYGISIFYLEDQPRLNGLLYITKYAHLCSYFLILTVGLLLFKRDLVPAYLLITAIVLTSVAMVLTLSRAPILAIFGGLSISLYFYKR